MIDILKTRFNANRKRHPDLKWDDVEKRQRKNCNSKNKANSGLSICSSNKTHKKYSSNCTFLLNLGGPWIITRTRGILQKLFQVK